MRGIIGRQVNPGNSESFLQAVIRLIPAKLTSEISYCGRIVDNGEFDPGDHGEVVKCFETDSRSQHGVMSPSCRQPAFC